MVKGNMLGKFGNEDQTCHSGDMLTYTHRHWHDHHGPLWTTWIRYNYILLIEVLQCSVFFTFAIKILLASALEHSRPTLKICRRYYDMQQSIVKC